ncbi:MAG TPA: response regulator [Ramlibacter sp.]|nr:response regulator [Ramlibacter sp.]
MGGSARPQAAGEEGPRPSPARQYLALAPRAHVFERYRPQVFWGLVFVWLLFLGLGANHFLQGRTAQGLSTTAFQLCLIVNAWCYWRQRPMLVPAGVIMAPVLVSLALAIRVQGMVGIFWCYPAVLLFHFLAPRRTANLFNLLVVAVAVPLTAMHLEPAMAARTGATLGLVILLTNLYSYIAEMQQAREAAQSQQLREQALQLEQHNAALREAIRVREEVERIARHDLKTPLASIASVSRLLRQGRAFDARETELLGLVERAAVRVLSMVNLSLELYRMEEGSYRLRPEAVDLSALARTVASELRAQADSKNLVWKLALPDEAARARGEELMCYAIVANLAKNALEAAPEAGTVTVAVRAHGDAFELAIHNDGAVPEPVRERFFEKYATHGKAGGTGLGTYSARLMARVQGGELRMASDTRAGTTLTLRLPAWPQAVPAVAPARKPAAAEAPAQAVQPGHGEDHGGTDPSVLLVDDDEYNILVLRSLLPARMRTREAVNGKAALDCLRRERADIVFLDLEMPVMGGLEAIARIRELQRDKGEVPSQVVAFSAHDDEATRWRCREAGFDLYLAKPATCEEVAAVLQGRPGALRQSRELSLPRGTARPVPLASAEDSGDHVVLIDPDLMELLPDFLESRRAMARQMEAATAAGDRAETRRLAHKLAGSLLMYGFAQAGHACAAVEETAFVALPDDLRRQAAAVCALLEQVRVRLRAPQDTRAPFLS